MISVATALKPTLIPTAELDLVWFVLGDLLGDRGKIVDVVTLNF